MQLLGCVVSRGSYFHLVPSIKKFLNLIHFPWFSFHTSSITSKNFLLCKWPQKRICNCSTSESLKFSLVIDLINLTNNCFMSKSSDTLTHILKWKWPATSSLLSTNLASVVFLRPAIPAIGITDLLITITRMHYKFNYYFSILVSSNDIWSLHKGISHHLSPMHDMPVAVS